MAVAFEECKQKKRLWGTREHNDIKCWQGFDTNLTLHPILDACDHVKMDKL